MDKVYNPETKRYISKFQSLKNKVDLMINKVDFIINKLESTKNKFKSSKNNQKEDIIKKMKEIREFEIEKRKIYMSINPVKKDRNIKNLYYHLL